MRGGRFAGKGGGCPASRARCANWGPDTLAWTALGAGYSEFARMVLDGGLARFYQDLRWPGWQDELAPIGEDRGISVYPFLFTAESRPVAVPAADPCRSPICLGAHAEADRQVAWLPPGSPLRVTITGSPGREDSPG